MKYFLTFFLIISLESATFFTDPARTGLSNNSGTSWANAFTNINQLATLPAGSLLIFSGGAAGTEQVYPAWTSTPRGSAAAGNIVCTMDYSDAAHNGTIVMNGNASANYGVNLPTYFTWDFLDTNTFIGHCRFTNNLVLDFYADGSTNIVIRGCHNGRRSFRLYTSTSWSISYCILDGETGAGIDYLLGFNGGIFPTAYGINTLHDCIIRPHKQNAAVGNGDDACQNPVGADIYNNFFDSVRDAGFFGLQHQDAIQTIGNKTRIYNNRFRNFSNSSVFLEFINSAADMQVIGNYFDHPDFDIATLGRDIDIFAHDTALTVDNMLVAFNTSVDNIIGQGIRVTWQSSVAVWTGCSIINNLTYNTGGGGAGAISLPAASGILLSRNQAIAGASGSGSISPANSTNVVGTFIPVAYTAYDPNNNFRPTVDVTGDPMVVFSSYPDPDGHARNALTPTIGVYQFLSSGNANIFLGRTTISGRMVIR